MRSRFETRLGTSVAALVLLGGAIAGCGGGGDFSDDSSASNGGEPVEIEFWHGQTQGPAELLQAMIDDFNSSHPDVVVSKDAGGVNSDRMLQKVTAGLQADNYPDIAYIYGSDLANLAQGEQLLDLSTAIDDGGLNWDRFVYAGKQAATVDGKLRAAPALIDNLAVVYNKKIFKQAGVPSRRRLDLGRVSERGRQADRPRRARRDRLAGRRRRGHDLADLAAGLAAWR